MNPRGPSNSKDIVQEHQDVRSLINQEVMPSLCLVVWIVIDDHRNNELSWKNRNARTCRNPTEDVDGTTPIALEII